MENKLLEALSDAEDFGSDCATYIIDELFYIKTRKDNSYILKLIKDTWQTIKDYNYTNAGASTSNYFFNNKVLRHFLYIIQTETNRNDISDIVREILNCGLSSGDVCNRDLAIDIIEDWEDVEYIDLLKDMNCTILTDSQIDERLRIIEESEGWECQN